MSLLIDEYRGMRHLVMRYTTRAGFEDKVFRITCDDEQPESSGNNG